MRRHYYLDCLPGGHHPGVLHLTDRVQEQLKPLLVMGRGEPDQWEESIKSVDLWEESIIIRLMTNE